MIAAQLLAYYFTELKDDQLKKVSESGRKVPHGSFCELCNVTAAWMQVKGGCVSARCRRGVLRLGERRMPRSGSGRNGGHDESNLDWIQFAQGLAPCDMDVLERGCGHRGWRGAADRQDLVTECFRSAGCQGI